MKNWLKRLFVEQESKRQHSLFNEVKQKEWEEMKEHWKASRSDTAQRKLDELNGTESFKRILPVLEETLSLLDDTYAEAEGSLKREVFLIWYTLDELVAKYSDQVVKMNQLKKH
ncbi:hypothetical protein ASL14_19160 [Paenibacillus sp. IHB B 3084]|uniref:hypothetical protein n=1 Tax=Paenibacillus sp. IHB B 3084 TaxID=867076 RepID=UPI00072078EF|nr:hypothetical protein [Paenibacillus sp. IHB B 3084]ALP37991.1 hypothetical protein ASL14_19160 [Paenibacillus sp. IHB B 3084]